MTDVESALSPEPGLPFVLVVDDEDLVLRVVSRALRGAGYDTLCTMDGEDAVARLAAEPDRFAAVVLDLTMPGLDGREVFDRLVRAKPGIPVLLISGYPEAEAALRFGADRPAAFLRKPFEVRELRAWVARLLETPPVPPASA